MIEKLDSGALSDDQIVFGDLDSDFVTFFSKSIGLNNITLDNINPSDDQFDYCDPDAITHFRLMGL